MAHQGHDRRRLWPEKAAAALLPWEGRSMSTPRSLAWPKPSRSVSYGVAVLTVATAVVTARLFAEPLDANPSVSLTNASNKFKQLWQQGFLLRQERAAETGGVEYVYYRIG